MLQLGEEKCCNGFPLCTVALRRVSALAGQICSLIVIVEPYGILDTWRCSAHLPS